MIDAPSFSSGSAFWTVNSVPRTFKSNVLSKISSVTFPIGTLKSAPPALANSTSICPFFAFTSANSRSRSARFAESPRTPTAPCPISLTALSSTSCRRPVTKTNAPSSANRSADASANPDVAPVTTATFPSNFFTASPFFD